MSGPVSSRSRTVRARAGALGLLAVVVLGACTHQQKIPESYGSTTNDNFIEGCVASLTDDDLAGDEAVDDAAAETTCTCIYEGISEGQDGIDAIPFEDFKQVNSELSEETTALPEEFQAHVDACRSQAGIS